MTRGGALFAAAAVAGLIFAGQAEAFRPSGRWLLDQAASRHLKRNINTLKVSQDVTLYGEPGAPKGLVVPGKVLIRSPEGMRTERERPEGTLLEVITPQKHLVERPGEGEQVRKARPDPVYAFLTMGGSLSRRDAAKRLEAALEGAKIDLDVVSFTRFDGRVSYLIGAKPWEVGEKPAAFFDKDTLHLTRLVTRKKGTDGQEIQVDVQLKGWGSAQGGGWFPQAIERYEDGELVSRALTREVERNDKVDASLFDVGK